MVCHVSKVARFFRSFWPCPASVCAQHIWRVLIFYAPALIHIIFDSTTCLIYQRFNAENKLRQKQIAPVDSSAKKNKISTEIQIFWKLSLLSCFQQQGLAHIFHGELSAWYRQTKSRYPQSKGRLTTTYYLYKKWKRTTKVKVEKTAAPHASACESWKGRGAVPDRSVEQ